MSDLGDFHLRRMRLCVSNFVIDFKSMSSKKSDTASINVSKYACMARFASSPSSGLLGLR